MHRHARTAGCIYQVVLRGELTRRLGVGWTPVRRGVAEIVGVPADLRRAFSTRRTEIEAELAATGGGGRRAAQRATYRTRRKKAHAQERSLRERWRRRGRELGYDPARLVRELVGRQVAPSLPPLARVAREMFGPAGLTANQTSFDRRDMIQTLTELLPTGLSITGERLEGAADRLLRERDAVPLLATAGNESRWSTAELLLAERRALRLAMLRTSVTPPDSSLVGRARLSAEQRRVVRGLLSSRDAVDVVVGPAGSGKTAALRTAAAAWRAAGTPVVGASLAAVTARRLEAASDIPSASLARLIGDLDKLDSTTGQPAGLARGTVVVIDGASMVGTRQLTTLLTHVTRAGGKLVLVGDPAQLPEIDAGGLFTVLAHRQPPLELRANQRQSHEWERRALTHLRGGHVTTALDAYVAQNRVHVGTHAHQLHEQMAVDYFAALESAASPYNVVVLATQRTDVDALNDAIRGRLRGTGRLGPDRLVKTTEDGPRAFAVGDRVLVTRNDHQRAVFNGTRGTVTMITGHNVRLRSEAGAMINLPVEGLADRLAHAYAMTVHKAQGLTVDTCLLYGTAALSQQAGYVALSRGRAANHIYTTFSALGGEPAGVEIGRPPAFQRLDGPDAADVLEALADRLGMRAEQTLAVHQRPAMDYHDLRRLRDNPDPDRGRDFELSR